MKEYDELTGLLTRKAFCRAVQDLLVHTPETSYDIVLSDFVNFKHFNERYGTDKGDFLLIKTAEMLSSAGTICGRYSADRFVSVVPHLEDFAISYLDHFTLPEEAREMLPVDSIVVKFGICPNITPDKPISVFCDHAYLALKSVKHTYGKNVAIYNENLADSVHRELFVEENMKKALETKQFTVYYQPKMDLSTGKMCGAEALVRWIHPDLGMISPGEFIPIFEKNGFIAELDFYVWNRVCEDLADWIKAGIPVVPISANASRRDLDIQDLSDRIIAIIDRHQLDHELFHLEVTESGYAEHPECVVRHVDKLREASVKIELDDFGSGYTSLSSLTDMNIDIMKLDRTLLKKDDANSEKSVLAFAMQLAKMMNLRTIQEGVETKEQLERLTSLGCDYIQGFFYAKPLPKEEFEKRLRTN